MNGQHVVGKSYHHFIFFASAKKARKHVKYHKLLAHNVRPYRVGDSGRYGPQYMQSK
jgi:hypothetical protein